jgi:hypothetical protein
MKRCLAVVVLVVSCSAFAQNQAASATQKAEAAKKAPATQQVTFGDDLIDGERLLPLGEIYTAPPASQFDCLIKVRTNFNDKLMQSVNEL